MTDPAPGSGVAGATREGAKNPQVHNLEESDSEPESYEETPEKISATKSSMTAYLEKIFSKRFDAMQSMAPGRTQAPGSPIKERSRSLLKGTLGPVPGTDLPSKKLKISDKENLPYFRIWKIST
ncbi:hypothetical protein F2Q69_00022520 [Brassica cretica]|uniref:Uncharacterized protein n=1 Tax=Brassica cretica TaxID=69181 RepID=A0A8S9PZZ0_BRACR|nr:hypothetical protein F2Q69_00022520 [Brassica cretica]